MGKRAGGGQTAEQWKKGQGRQGRGGLAWAEEMGWVCRKQEDKQEMGGDSLERQHGSQGSKRGWNRGAPRDNTVKDPLTLLSALHIRNKNEKMRNMQLSDHLRFTSHKLSVRWKEQEIIVFVSDSFSCQFFSTRLYFCLKFLFLFFSFFLEVFIDIRKITGPTTVVNKCAFLLQCSANV